MLHTLKGRELDHFEKMKPKGGVQYWSLTGFGVKDCDAEYQGPRQILCRRFDNKAMTWVIDNIDNFNHQESVLLDCGYDASSYIPIEPIKPNLSHVFLIRFENVGLEVFPFNADGERQILDKYNIAVSIDDDSQNSVTGGESLFVDESNGWAYSVEKVEVLTPERIGEYGD